MTPTASIVIPTRDRRAVLCRTLERLVALGEDVEILVVDNASTDDTRAAVKANYPDVRLIALDENLAAAGRNEGAYAAGSNIVVMLDDDSWLDRASLDRMCDAIEADASLAAAAALVRRPGERVQHETGGLPGVLIGCGAAIRRDVFCGLGGYPADYEFYVEEYDWCCRAWQVGWRVQTFRDIVVTHERVQTGRDMNRVLRLLTRNNLKLWSRFAPEGRRAALLEETRTRYCRIAHKENAVAGYEQGCFEADAEIAHITPEPLTDEQFDAMYGITDARNRLAKARDCDGVRAAAMIGRAKGAEQVVECMNAAGISLTAVYDDHGRAGETWLGAAVLPEAQLAADRPDAIVTGTLSPGTCLDLAARAATICPDVRVYKTVGLQRAATPAGVAS